jgi:hypothetical protein
VHVSLTRASTSDVPMEVATLVSEEMVRWLRDIDGFEGFVMLSREGESIGLSFWASEEIANEHRPARVRFIERMTAIAGVQVEEIVDYRLMFAELSPRVAGLEPDTPRAVE